MKRPWLTPFVPLYRAGLVGRELRLARGWESVRRLHEPVISIGNLSTGGSGKTPLAITVCGLLQQRGIHIDVLSRGYGRSSREPARVDPNGTSEQFGDEPLLIARAAGVPVYVAPQRYDAGQLAESERMQGSSPDASRNVTRAHILDDGFQHRQLHRDVNILLLNREDGEDGLLPAGNLREPLNAAKRAHVIAIPADDSTLESDLRDWGWGGPVWRLQRRMTVPQIDGTALAFCGIARPDQFFSGLTNAAIKIAGSKTFRDHHRYTRKDLHALVAEARNLKAAALVTTEKDGVRLGELISAFPPELPLKTANLRIEIEEAGAAMAWLTACLAPHTASNPL